MSKGTPAVCVAVLAPDNAPIFLEKYAEDENLELESLIFDSIAFNGNKSTFKAPVVPGERFVGCVSKTQKYQIWGYQASLHYKIVIITSGKYNVTETSVKQCFEAIADALIGAVRNPFYSPFSQISSDDFSKRVRTVCELIRIIPQSTTV